MTMTSEEVKQKTILVLEAQLSLLENNYLLRKDQLEKQITTLKAVQ